MTALRFWIFLLAGTSFLGGVTVARLLDTPPPAEPALSAAFVARFSETFDLESEPRRVEALQVIARHYEEEKLGIERRHQAVYRTAMEDELIALGTKYEAWVRDRVLPPAKRAQYDLLAGDFSMTLAPR
ncbi:MAG: hypothetical protein ACI8QC_001530 [Planctomycetota bacterium]|jgi:hypothetical protein